MSDAPSLYAQGLKKHREQDYAEAVRLLEAAVAAQPRFADAWEALGVLYDKVGRTDDAIAAMQRLLEVDPEAIMAYTNLSRFYMKKGLTEQAEDAQGKARMLGWKQDLAAAPASDGLVQAGSSPAPATSAPVSLASLAGTPPAPAPAAAATEDAEALARKIRQFEAVLAANPADDMARLTLGKAHSRAGQHEAAIRILEELIERTPDYSAAYPALAGAYRDAGKLARAIKTYKKGIEVADARGDLHPRNQMQQALTELTGER
jgi:tetratricopeptide (TPR) repeat protein